MRLKQVVSAKPKILLFVVMGLMGCTTTNSKPKVEGPESAVEAPQPKAKARALPRASTLVREGEGLLAQGDAKGAKAKFDAAIAENDKDARAYLGLGLTYEALSEFPAAEASYRKSLEADPNLAEAHNNLGLLLKDAGRDDEALLELSRAVELDPKLASAQANLAMALEDAGRVADAQAAYERAVALTPDDAMLRANHGLFLLDNGDAQGATLTLRAGLQRAKGNRAALVAIGNGLRRAVHPDEAVRALQAAIEAGDGKPTAALLSELALAQHAAGDAAAARASLEQAISLDAKYASAHYVLAGILASQGDLKRAAEHYKRCIDLDPKGPLAARAKEKLAAAKRAPKAR